MAATAPPDVPWAWGEEETIEGLRRLERGALVEAYRTAREAEGASADQGCASGTAADEMLEFKQEAGGALVDWTASPV